MQTALPAHNNVISQWIVDIDVKILVMMVFAHLVWNFAILVLIAHINVKEYAQKLSNAKSNVTKISFIVNTNAKNNVINFPARLV